LLGGHRSIYLELHSISMWLQTDGHHVHMVVNRPIVYKCSLLHISRVLEIFWKLYNVEFGEEIASVSQFEINNLTYLCVSYAFIILQTLLFTHKSAGIISGVSHRPLAN
jgi:hypothetical protein